MYYDDSESQRTPYRPYSEETAQRIDHKVSDILKNAYTHAKQILTDNKSHMDNLATLLRAREYMSREEFGAFMEDSELLARFATDR